MPDQPDPPNRWRVYHEDETPVPEAPPPPPEVPYGDAPHVPYGSAQASDSPIFVTTKSSGFTPGLTVVLVIVAVFGVAVAGAIAIFATVGSDVISGAAGVDPKEPDDFEEMVEALADQTGSTEVFSVGLYDGYAILYTPVDDSTKSIGWRWDGGGIEEWTKTTSTDERFDVSAIDPAVIGDMCDPVLEQADGATPGDCYVQIRKPASGDAWFSAGASDEFGQYYSVMYDKQGVEVSRYP